MKIKRRGRRIGTVSGKRRRTGNRSGARQTKTEFSASERRHFAQLVICSGVFVLLVAAKLLLPGKMQEVNTALNRMLEKNMDFESADHEKAWLIRVCINLCKDSLKSSWNRKVFSIHDRDFTSPSYEIRDSSPILSYIRTLPPNQKTAIYLHYYEDMPVNEIAGIMGAKQNTVLSWLRRGRKTLEKIIKEEL